MQSMFVTSAKNTYGYQALEKVKKYLIRLFVECVKPKSTQDFLKNQSIKIKEIINEYNKLYESWISGNLH